MNYALLDELFGKVEEEFEAKGKPLCPGCTASNCCSLMVNSWPEEWAEVAKRIRGTQMEQKVHDWWVWFRTLSLTERWDDLEFLRAAKRDDRPCPLLVDGRCSVYDIRPFACRGMYSKEASPEKCSSDGESIWMFDATPVLMRWAPGNIHDPRLVSALPVGIGACLQWPGAFEMAEWICQKQLQAAMDDPSRILKDAPRKVI